jgi:hypothetical protein
MEATIGLFDGAGIVATFVAISAVATVALIAICTFVTAVGSRATYVRPRVSVRTRRTSPR